MTEIRRYDATPSPDVLVQRSTRYFDERGRHWKTSDLFKDPSTTYSDAVTTIERFKTGHVRYVTNPRGKVTETQYDAAWRVSKTIDAMGNEVQNTYDAASRRTAWAILEKDGTTSITHGYGATYDDLGRMLTRTEKDRNNSSHILTTTFDYDSRGNLVWVVNAKGDPTRFTFDGLSRMTKKEVALAYGSPIETFTSAIVTQWAFDKNNRLTSFQDDATNTSTWAYDAKDRPTSMSYPDTTSIAYTYNATDQVTQVTDAAGNVIADTFDALGRNTARSVTKATGFVDTSSETRSYDAVNRLTAAEDNDYRVEFTYGVIGLSSTVYEETQKYTGSTPKTKTVTTTYNGVGSMTSQTYPSSLALAYSYNDIDRLSSVSDGTNTIASFSYIGTRPKITTFQNGTTDNRTYGGFREEVTSIHHKTSGGATLVRMDYGYDAVHDRTYERFGASGSSGDAFEYDKARRLTKAWMGSSAPESPSGNTYVKTIAYNMDDDGNRTSVVTTPYGQSAQTTSYSTNNLNQYTAVGGTSQTYDGNGNLTNDGTLKFVYNYKNLICEVKQQNDALVATYAYDALGRRVEKWVNSGSVTERYVYSDVEIVCIYDAGDVLRQEFAYDVTGIDGLLMLQQRDLLDYDSDSDTAEAIRSFYHQNAVGSVMTLSDPSQAAAVSYRYSPFGGITITIGGTPQATDPLGQFRSFAGSLHDEASVTVHMRARSFAVYVGRFQQRDPLGYGPGPNQYTYAQSAPLCYVDPLGLSPIPGRDSLDEPTDISSLDEPTGDCGCTCVITGKDVKKTIRKEHITLKVNGFAGSVGIWGGGTIRVYWKSATRWLVQWWRVTTTKCHGDDCAFVLRIKSKLLHEGWEYEPATIGHRWPNYWDSWNLATYSEHGFLVPSIIPGVMIWGEDLLAKIGYNPDEGDTLAVTEDSQVGTITAAQILKSLSAVKVPHMPPGQKPPQPPSSTLVTPAPISGPPR